MTVQGSDLFQNGSKKFQKVLKNLLTNGSTCGIIRPWLRESEISKPRKLLQKKVEKPLDKPFQVWYNKGEVRPRWYQGQQPMIYKFWVATDARKEVVVMSEKIVRVTKAQRFADIKALLMGEAVSNGTTVEDAIGVLDHEIDLLARKNSSGEKKPTAEQVKNEGYKETILEYLGSLPEDGKGKTCTEILKAIPDFADFSNQKVAALMRQLKIAGRVKTVEAKGKTLFSLA